MLSLVLLGALLGLTSAATQGLLLPTGITPQKIHSAAFAPITVPERIDHKAEIRTGEGAAEETNEHKILTPANTVLTPDTQPLAPRKVVLLNAFPSLHGFRSLNTHFSEKAVKTRVARQVLGSPVWDRKAIDWAVKNCQHLPVIGGAVAGASGGPLGVLLGVVGAGIGACNFNK